MMTHSGTVKDRQLKDRHGTLAQAQACDKAARRVEDERDAKTVAVRAHFIRNSAKQRMPRCVRIDAGGELPLKAANGFVDSRTGSRVRKRGMAGA